MNILDGQIDFHGLTLRPLTIGSMELCRAFGLGLFTGEMAVYFIALGLLPLKWWQSFKLRNGGAT